MSECCPAFDRNAGRLQLGIRTKEIENALTRRSTLSETASYAAECGFQIDGDLPDQSSRIALAIWSARGLTK